MDSLDDVLLSMEEGMSKSADHLQHEFASLRTGKASPALVENVNVPYYGTATRLRELAGITTPEARLIVIKPFDPSIVAEIQKAIGGANLGVSPINDGKIIRVPIPELSEERRGEITKIAKRMAEESRVAVRNIRRDTNDAVKSLQKDGKISGSRLSASSAAKRLSLLVLA